MFCRECGKPLFEDAKFCSYCGTPVLAAPQEPEVVESEPVVEQTVAEEPVIEVKQKPAFDEINWNVDEYPDRNAIEKTEDVNFNWSTGATNEKAPAVEPVELPVAEPVIEEVESDEISASERIDKFYTFNKKNEEFQQLLNREYQKVKSGNAIEEELSKADERAKERFDNRPEDNSMEAFLEREGIEKPYAPKPFESDVLERIEAQELANERKRHEEEARMKAIEEARLKAIEEKKAREAEEARIRAEQEARLKAAEEERLKAEERARAEAEAAKAREEEEARLRAEAEFKAAQEAAKIRAQREAKLAAEEEARLKAEEARRQAESSLLRDRLQKEQDIISRNVEQDLAAEEAKKVLAQTARMKEEEAAKIRAAIAGLRGTDSPATAEPVIPDVHVEPVVPVTNTVKETSEPLTSIEDLMADNSLSPSRNEELDRMAKARTAFFTAVDAETGTKAEPVQQPSTDRVEMLSADDDLTKTRTIDKAAVLSGLEATRRISKAELSAQQDRDFFRSLDDVNNQTQVRTPQPIPAPVEDETLQDIFGGKDSVESLLDSFTTEVPEEPIFEPKVEENFTPEPAVIEGFVSKDEPTAKPAPGAGEDKNPGLQDTMVMPAKEIEGSITSDFDDYGVKEAEAFKKAQAQANAANIEGISTAEAIEDDLLEEEKGGKGSIILKIILIILIVIFAVELAGIGVKFLIPQSRAAQLMNNQLNKVIHLITGEEDTQYAAFVAAERTDLLDDKTDLINAQMSKNKNIKEITYNSELKYDASTQSSVTDLVLSQPMTEVKWGNDEDNYPVYYDEQVIGQIIAFESARIDNRNKGDTAILDMIDQEKGKKLYQETKSVTNKKSDGEFEKLEIGEIRTGSGKFLVWVRETIGGKSVDRVYAMYPEKKFELKMVARYNLDK